MSQRDIVVQNNMIRFISVTKKSDGLFVNFKVKGIRGGVVFSASLSVDATAADVEMTDPLEKIIETCAYIAVREIQRTEFQFEGLVQV